MQHTKFSLTQPYSKNILFIYMETLLLNKHWNQWSLVVRNLCPNADVFKRAEFPACPSPLWSHALSPACLFQEGPWKTTILWRGLSQPKNSQVTRSWQLRIHRQYHHTSPVSSGCQAKNIAICINCSEEFQPWTTVGIVPPIAQSQI